MAIVVMIVGLVAMLQGAAWLGPRRARPRAALGALVSSVGVLAFVGGLVSALVPGFWS